MSVRAREAISVLTFLPLYLLFFLIGTETFLVSPLLPSIAKDFREDVSMVAHTVTSYVLVYALFAPWLGNLSDRVGRKMFIVVGAVIFCFGNILASISTGVWFLIVARAIAGLGGAMAGPAMWAYISDETDQLMRGRANRIWHGCFLSRAGCWRSARFFYCGVFALELGFWFNWNKCIDGINLFIF